MTSLEIVPSEGASLYHYHRIYLICRIHAIHKLPMSKMILEMKSAYLLQYPFDGSIDLSFLRKMAVGMFWLCRSLESRPPLQIVEV